MNLGIGEVLWGVSILVTGAVGWQKIQAFFLRPRLYRAHRPQALVTLTDAPRRARIEELLRQEGEPTALLEIEWWNTGRKASGTTIATVTVPGTTVGQPEVVENREARTTPPVQIALHGTDTVVLTKTSLNPSAVCRVVVGYHPTTHEAVDQVSVLMHHDGRVVLLAPPPGTVSGWIIFPMLAVAFVTPYLAARFVDAQHAAPWVPGAVWGAGLLGLLGSGVWITRRLAAAPKLGPSWQQAPRKKV
jgi:hypothetical protein